MSDKKMFTVIVHGLWDNIEVARFSAETEKAAWDAAYEAHGEDYSRYHDIGFRLLED